MKHILVFFLMFISISLFAQKVAIELSIEWKQSGVADKQIEVTKTPYLRITYNNLTCDSIYFCKIYKSETNLPYFITSGLFSKLIVDNNHEVFQTDTFSVYIGNNPPNNVFWDVLPDSVDYYSEREIESYMNDLLFEYYNAFSVNYGIQSDIYSELQDISTGTILDRISDDFIFLAPKCTLSEFFNLDGFKRYKGTYRFLIGVKELAAGLNIDSYWDQQLEYWKFRYAELPLQIRGYHLVSGSIISNQVIITF